MATGHIGLCYSENYNPQKLLSLSLAVDTQDVPVASLECLGTEPTAACNDLDILSFYQVNRLMFIDKSLL